MIIYDLGYIGYGLLFYDTIIDIWKPLWNIALKAVPSIFFMELLKKIYDLDEKNYFHFFHMLCWMIIVQVISYMIISNDVIGWYLIN